MSKCLWLLALALFCVSSIAQIKPRNQYVTVSQPDGTKVLLRHVVRKSFNFYETLDGYVVKKDSTGYYKYVEGILNDDFVLSSVTVRSEEERISSNQSLISGVLTSEYFVNYVEGMQTSGNNQLLKSDLYTLSIKDAVQAIGSPNIPVVLVQFSDKKFSIGETDEEIVEKYDLFFNSTEQFSEESVLGSAGSVKRYFTDQSDSLFIPQFTIIGPVTLDRSYKYYGENSIFTTDRNISKFFSETIQKAQLVCDDWSVFDNNGDGSIDMCFMIYAGEGENHSELDSASYLIWPSEFPYGGTINELSFASYSCSNELFNGVCDGIGTVCHEFSHALGIPDFYDTNYVAYGMDFWDLMDYGSYCDSGYCPCGYGTFEKEYLGWKSLITLEYGVPRKITLYPVSEGGVGYKVVNQENSDEYYILENRQSIGWDSYIGYGTEDEKHNGMLVVHVDYVSSRWGSNTVNTVANHQLFTIIPADGELDSYMYAYDSDLSAYLQSAAGDTYPGLYGVSSLEDDRATVFTPSGYMNQPIRDIEQNSDGTVTFKYFVTEKLNAPVISTNQYSNYIGWDEVPNAIGYELLISSESDMSDSTKISVSANAYNLSDTLSRMKHMYVCVRAVADTLLNSEYSDVVEIDNNAADYILPVISDDTNLVINGNEISINENAVICSISGSKVAELRKGTNRTNLDGGLYILQTADKSYKIMIK